jgi:hypothetical protein
MTRRKFIASICALPFGVAILSKLMRKTEDEVIELSGRSFTITLPPAEPGKTFTIRNDGGVEVTIQTGSSGTVPTGWVEA